MPTAGTRRCGRRDLNSPHTSTIAALKTSFPGITRELSAFGFTHSESLVGGCVDFVGFLCGGGAVSHHVRWAHCLRFRDLDWVDCSQGSRGRWRCVNTASESKRHSRPTRNEGISSEAASRRTVSGETLKISAMVLMFTIPLRGGSSILKPYCALRLRPCDNVRRMELFDSTWWANVSSTLVGVVAGGLISAAVAFALYRRDRKDHQADRESDNARSQAERREDSVRARITGLRGPAGDVVAALGRWQEAWIRGDGKWPKFEDLDAASLRLIATGEHTAESVTRWIRSELAKVDRIRDDDSALILVQDLVQHAQNTVVSWSKAPDEIGEFLAEALRVEDEQFNASFEQQGLAYEEMIAAEYARRDRRTAADDGGHAPA
jgi:hypothetical protein